MANELSLCMIVKNEEKAIGNCLSSVREIADEIIIVDTGSTDRTKEIASEFGAKIFDFKWGDDFSKARNESLKHATKEWILVLDADEEISKEDLPKLRNLLMANNKLGVIFEIWNYSDSSNVPGWMSLNNSNRKRFAAGYYPSKKLVLFKNMGGIKFEGKIHESVFSFLVGKGSIATADFPIHHFGKL